MDPSLQKSKFETPKQELVSQKGNFNKMNLGNSEKFLPSTISYPTPSQASSRRGPPRYCLLFDKSPTSAPEEGYLLIKIIAEGGQSSGAIVRSATTGKLYFRKHFRPNGPMLWPITDREVRVTQELSHNDVSVNFESVYDNGKAEFLPDDPRYDENYDYSIRALVTCYCNGGNVKNYVIDHCHTTVSRELIVWHILISAIPALAWLHSSNASSLGGIWHGDAHAANLFLDFHAGEPFPRVVFGDYGNGRFQHQTDATTAYDNNLNIEGELFFVLDLKSHLQDLSFDFDQAPALETIFEIFEDPNSCTNVLSADHFVARIRELAIPRMRELIAAGGPTMLPFQPPPMDLTPKVFKEPKVTVENGLWWLRGVLSEDDNEEIQAKWHWVRLHDDDTDFTKFTVLRHGRPPHDDDDNDDDNDGKNNGKNANGKRTRDADDMHIDDNIDPSPAHDQDESEIEEDPQPPTKKARTAAIKPMAKPKGKTTTIKLKIRATADTSARAGKER